jgi:periplasmic serine protease, Do/DeqQ family
MKRITGIVFIAAITSLATLLVAKNYVLPQVVIQSTENTPVPSAQFASYTESMPQPQGYVNLEDAAERSSKAVVHIETKTKARAVEFRHPFGDDFFDQFFGGTPRYFQQPQQSSGSGVIVSPNGYVVTNNHVVDNADEVTVVLTNKKRLSAKVLGKDPSTDLAVLKVEESNLPYIAYGNSDDVKLGQWVLAIGYPLTLETTVTAGIVSAKYRNIGINQTKSGSSAVESFIQTDAAVNPGNSGGALVNARGELIGINSAIASPTGSYAGYSFAIPSNIVKKVVNDIISYGNVQRAYLGVGYIDKKNATPEQLSAYKLDKIDGVYISQVFDGSSAGAAGLKAGDIITKIGDRAVSSGPEMTEQIAQFRPGDQTTITYVRDGKSYTTKINFLNKLGTTSIVKQDAAARLGLSLKELTRSESKSLGIQGGILVTDILSDGVIAKQTRMRKNFIITQVNEKEVNRMIDFEKIVASGDKEYQISGIYPNYQGIYNYLIRLE